MDAVLRHWASGLGPSGLGPSGLAAPGLRPSGLRVSGLRMWDLGSSGLPGRGWLGLWCLVAALALLAVLSQPARAQIGSDRYSDIVVEVASGNVLEQVSPDAPRHPASLAKLMTLYMVFEALRDRRITDDEPVPVSAHAAEMEPSKLGLVPGMRMTVEQAILGLVTKSANDAAAALGELLGGSEDRFAEMMTLRARAMGMSHTTFTNASGLPDDRQLTTARDLAVLARRLVSDFPGDYRYFSTASFTFQGRTIFNHDNMLRSYPGADGMKTGYTEASGHNLVTSAVRGGVRLIGVELGAGSNAARDVHMAVLLNQGFDAMGVAPPARETVVASRTPSLVGSAHAATLNEMHASAGTKAGNAAGNRAANGAASGATSATAGGASGGSVRGWGVQLGSYATERVAREAAASAHRAAEGGEPRVDHVTVHGAPLWRARVVGLTAARAQGACSALAHTRTTCVVLRPEPGQTASR
jgi:D-alanyl-D-alanine carboxypeptidase